MGKTGVKMVAMETATGANRYFSNKSNTADAGCQGRERLLKGPQPSQHATQTHKLSRALRDLIPGKSQGLMVYSSRSKAHTTGRSFTAPGFLSWHLVF